ncbi:MAG TPA: acyltransferase [Aquabacterium sp.]|uniref:acyltransferase n=1 Tax=Aquabacterium sp. TaxID=1872578 RepID=UPI002E35B307|nr:acyltransferase [Aquabacterium sp.]HEX5371248.1 acyltransferase [Aquabacterium sp.]
MSKIPSQLVSTKVLRSGVQCEQQYLSGVDILTSHMGIPVIQVYKHGLDVEVLERSLVTTLARYPLITGRMKKDAQGLPYIIGNDAGITFTVRRCKGPLPDYGPHHHMADHLGSFYTPIYPWQVFKDSTALAHVNIYQFDDGGAILGICMVHSLIDGQSFWQFMVDWADAAKGKDTPARPMDRSQIIQIGQQHIDQPFTKGYAYQATWSQWLRTAARLGWGHLFKLDKGVFRIPASTVQQWKAQAQAEGQGAEGVIPSELVTAHCLKVLSPLWAPDKVRYLGMVIDLRYKRSLRIPRYFFGNALGHRDVPYTAQELAQDSLATIGLKSRTSPEGLDTQDLQAYLGMMERARQAKKASLLMMRSVASSPDGGFVLNNCSHFPIYDIDFGTGKPTWHDPIRVVFRMLMVIGTPEGDGGFDIHLTGTRAELAVFKKLYG